MCQSANCDLLACSVYVLVLQRVIWRGIHLFILQRESIPIFTACAVFKSIWMLLWLGLFKCYSHANNRCGISLQLCRITRYKMYFPYNWKYQMKFPDGRTVSRWQLENPVYGPCTNCFPLYYYWKCRLSLSAPSHSNLLEEICSGKGLHRNKD